MSCHIRALQSETHLINTNIIFLKFHRKIWGFFLFLITVLAKFKDWTKMVYPQNTRRPGSYQTKSAINLKSSICETNASYSPHTHLNSFFGGRRDERLNPSCHKIILRYTNSRREETCTKPEAQNTTTISFFSVSLEPIFNKVYLTFKIFFSSYQAELQILQISRNSTFYGLDLQSPHKLPVLPSATIHTKSKHNLEYDIVCGMLLINFCYPKANEG